MDLTGYDPLPGQGPGADFIASLPAGQSATVIKDREALLIDAVKTGRAQVRWAFVTTTWKGKAATIPVMADALAIGETGVVRISTTYPTAQAIADLLGNAQLLTPKIAHVVQLQAKVSLPALTQPWFQGNGGDGTMSETFRIKDYNTKVDAKLAGLGGAAKNDIVGNVGKDWVVTLRWKGTSAAKKHSAANYGFYALNGPYMTADKPFRNLWQSTGLAHNFGHTDYSQLLRFMRRTMLIDEVVHSTADVMMDAALAPRVTGVEGKLPYWRHPDLPAPPAQVG